MMTYKERISAMGAFNSAHSRRVNIDRGNITAQADYALAERNQTHNIESLIINNATNMNKSLMSPLV